MKKIFIGVTILLSFTFFSCTKSSINTTPKDASPTSPNPPRTGDVPNYADSSIANLMAYSNGNTYSNLTPMGIHYAGRHVTVDADRVWLNTAANEPPVPASTSGLHWANCAVVLYLYGKPSPVEVNQHSIGDCDGLAALACIAYEDPSFIQKIIKDNGDGTYTVSMYDPQGNPVTVVVTSKFLVGSDGVIAACSSKDNKATWATVLEKAIMKYNYIYKVNPDIGGIGSEYALALFTGNGSSFAFAAGSLTPDHLQRVVQVCLAKGYFITGGFNVVSSIGVYQTVTGHAYTVMITGDQNALFSMRNPWGFSPGSIDGSEDGVLNIPNVGSLTSTIDLRIIDPGNAGIANVTEPYKIPSFASSPNNLRVDKVLMRSGL